MSGSVFSISFSRSGAVAVAAPFPFPFLGVGDTEIKHYLVDLLTFSCFNKLNQFQLHLTFKAIGLSEIVGNFPNFP